MQGRIYAGEDIYAGAAVEAQKADKTGTLVCNSWAGLDRYADWAAGWVWYGMVWYGIV